MLLVIIKAIIVESVVVVESISRFAVVAVVIVKTIVVESVLVVEALLLLFVVVKALLEARIVSLKTCSRR